MAKYLLKVTYTLDGVKGLKSEGGRPVLPRPRR
jgi:hypothetical protein